ncbi:MAG TPA: hypothetical protein VFX85_00575 [Solirubrobacterales bacterium]|nr:hypothetical protein [Solirubrobacterales bacterium]
MTLHRRLGSIYSQIGRTYLSKGPSLLLLATAVFVPLGLLEVLVTEAEIDSIDFESGLQVAAILLATAAITVTGLLGEVFYSGAVAVSLTHPKGEKPPSILEVAKRLDYRRLILVDIVYVALVIVGLLIFFVPGILVFVWFGLSGPIVELEGRGVRDALRRSVNLVRGNFWLVFLVLAPVELVGDLVGELAEHGVHDLLGESFFSTWMGAAASGIVFTPIFALAAVLLTLELIDRRDADASSPAPLATPSR